LLPESLKAVVLLAFGTFVISMADNVLLPIVVGRATQMPDYLVLLSTMGGLGLFGITGFVVGPVVAALFLVAWQLYAAERQQHDPMKPLPPPPADSTQMR
jgi:predicted PurR-regulated permease PerM